MKKALNKLFLNDTLFLVFIIVLVLGEIYFTVVQVIDYPESMDMILVNLLEVICGVNLYFSYKDHKKNVMKGLMGAVLALELSLSIMSLGAEYVSIVNYLAILMAFLMFLNHFIINKDHHSNPNKIFFNQIVAILYAIVTCFGYLELLSYVGFLDFSHYIADELAHISLIGIVICVESRLDMFRQLREKVGENEEDDES